MFFFQKNTSIEKIQLKLCFAVVIFVTAALQCFYQNCTNLHAMLYGNCNCKYLQLISL